MRYVILIFSLMVPLAVSAPQASANAVERACRQLDRSSATPARCACVGKVASQKLSASERRKVAGWFSDPHQAQVVRQSDRRRDEKLWARYRAFGDAAERACG